MEGHTPATPPAPVVALGVAAAGIVEGLTYFGLLAAVVARSVVDRPGAVHPLGLIHGLAFLAYAGAVLRARRRAGWDAVRTVTLLAASAIPAGGFVVARRLRRGSLTRSD